LPCAHGLKLLSSKEHERRTVHHVFAVAQGFEDQPLHGEGFKTAIYLPRRRREAEAASSNLAFNILHAANIFETRAARRLPVNRRTDGRRVSFQTRELLAGALHTQAD
jgi:hypothetical protein